MALGDIFKKKSKKEIKEEVKDLDEAKEETKKEQILETKPKKEKKADIAFQILKEPQITEKATILAEKNQYVFKVWPRANKTEIKKAIEGLYNVNVISVKIINVPPKKRRLGRISGWRKGYKKAIVKIKEGQKIEVLPR